MILEIPSTLADYENKVMKEAEEAMKQESERIHQECMERKANNEEYENS